MYYRVYSGTCEGIKFCEARDAGGDKSFDAPAFSGAGGEHGEGDKTAEPSALRRDPDAWKKNTGTELGNTRGICAACKTGHARRASPARGSPHASR